MNNTINITDNDMNLHIYIDNELQIEGIGKFGEICDDNLISFLYYFLNDVTLTEFKKSKKTDIYIAFINKIKSLRKTHSSCVQTIKEVYFNEYTQCSNDIQSLVASEGNRYLQINIDDYVITDLTIDEYIDLNAESLMTIYETLHDQLLLKLEFFKDFAIITGDDALELWEDYDEHVRIDWNQLEAYVAHQFNEGILSIYAIRKVRKGISKYKNISTNRLTYFAPLKESYERKYYQLKEIDNEQ